MIFLRRLAGILVGPATKGGIHEWSSTIAAWIAIFAFFTGVASLSISQRDTFDTSIAPTAAPSATESPTPDTTLVATSTDTPAVTATAMPTLTPNTPRQPSPTPTRHTPSATPSPFASTTPETYVAPTTIRGSLTGNEVGHVAEFYVILPSRAGIWDVSLVQVGDSQCLPGRTANRPSGAVKATLNQAGMEFFSNEQSACIQTIHTSISSRVIARVWNYSSETFEYELTFRSR